MLEQINKGIKNEKSICINEHNGEYSPYPNLSFIYIIYTS